ncbi:hypothetical protein Bca4012_051453 [Brassica carinata]|uniref:Uncharacterized protein n=1 Tax=Brassica carinata TaxID=52824 RepID=A0A8X7R7S7_BRACI|nr:hypothetical protein Bca52824_054027 [Brassica carinata]
MKDESGLFPDSSSIGSRVRSSKVKDAVAPLMEDPKAIVALNVLPVAEGNRYPPIGPLLVIGVEEVADWRMKYNLPADVIIRVPVFAGNWTEKFAFMRLPGFLPIWQLEGRLAVGVTMVL